MLNVFIWIWSHIIILLCLPYLGIMILFPSPPLLSILDFIVCVGRTALLQLQSLCRQAEKQRTAAKPREDEDEKRCYLRLFPCPPSFLLGFLFHRVPVFLSPLPRVRPTFSLRFSCVCSCLILLRSSLAQSLLFFFFLFVEVEISLLLASFFVLSVCSCSSLSSHSISPLSLIIARFFRLLHFHREGRFLVLCVHFFLCLLFTIITSFSFSFSSSPSFSPSFSSSPSRNTTRTSPPLLPSPFTSLSERRFILLCSRSSLLLSFWLSVSGCGACTFKGQRRRRNNSRRAGKRWRRRKKKNVMMMMAKEGNRIYVLLLRFFCSLLFFCCRPPLPPPLSWGGQYHQRGQNQVKKPAFFHSLVLRNKWRRNQSWLELKSALITCQFIVMMKAILTHLCFASVFSLLFASRMIPPPLLENRPFQFGWREDHAFPPTSIISLFGIDFAKQTFLIHSECKHQSPSITD